MPQRFFSFLGRLTVNSSQLARAAVSLTSLCRIISILNRYSDRLNPGSKHSEKWIRFWTHQYCPINRRTTNVISTDVYVVNNTLVVNVFTSLHCSSEVLRAVIDALYSLMFRTLRISTIVTSAICICSWHQLKSVIIMRKPHFRNAGWSVLLLKHLASPISCNDQLIAQPASWSLPYPRLLRYLFCVCWMQKRYDSNIRDGEQSLQKAHAQPPGRSDISRSFT